MVNINYLRQQLISALHKCEDKTLKLNMFLSDFDINFLQNHGLLTLTADKNFPTRYIVEMDKSYLLNFCN